MIQNSKFWNSPSNTSYSPGKVLGSASSTNLLPLSNYYLILLEIYLTLFYLNLPSTSRSVWVNMYVCVCVIHVYVYTYIYIYIHVFIWVYNIYLHCSSKIFLFVTSPWKREKEVGDDCCQSLNSTLCSRMVKDAVLCPE